MNFLTKILCILICSSVLLSTTGCAYNSTNPVARYASYGGTIGAVPGVLGLAIAGSMESDDDDADNSNADNVGLFSVILLGAGFVGGFAIGAIIGTFRWFIAGNIVPDPAPMTDGTINAPPNYREPQPDPANDPWQQSPIVDGNAE